MTRHCNLTPRVVSHGLILRRITAKHGNMETIMKNAIQVIITALFLGVFSVPAFAEDTQTVEVLSATPGVMYRLFETRGDVKAGMKLAVNSVVTSGSGATATLRFFDGTILEIEPDSEVFLVDFSDGPTEDVTMFMLNSGTVKMETGDSESRKDKPIIVHTPQISIGIRGTTVIIQAQDGKNHVYMTSTSGKGIVVHDKKTGNNEEVVAPGKILTVAPDTEKECTNSSCIVKKFGHEHKAY